MRVDTSHSIYSESSTARQEFDASELRRLRFLLRRLQFLESKIDSDPSVSSGSIFAEKEIEALEWVLEDIGYLIISRGESQ